MKPYHYILLGIICFALLAGLISAIEEIGEITNKTGRLVLFNGVEQLLMHASLLVVGAGGALLFGLKGKPRGPLYWGVIAAAICLGFSMAFIGPYANHAVMEASTGRNGENWTHCKTYTQSSGRSSTNYHVYSSDASACFALRDRAPDGRYWSGLYSTISRINRSRF